MENVSLDQKLTWERPGRDEERFKRYLIRALLRSGVCAILEDECSNYLFVANLLEAWQLPADALPTDLLLFGPELAAQLGELKAEVRRSGEPGQIEVHQEPDSYYQFIVEPLPSPDDEVDLMTTIIELSEERRREKALRTLLREVSHRSKNLLAIIQSIAAQTARHSQTIEAFVQKFRGRLYSLSLSQDLVTDSLWRGATLADLVNEQVRRYLPEAAGNVELHGGEHMFSPNAALHIGLALHELIINALTHGSLTTSGSGVVVSCTTSRKDGMQMVTFEWTEQRQADASRHVADDGEETPHFGRSILERILPASVSGTASYELTAEEVVYRLEFPADLQDD